MVLSEFNICLPGSEVHSLPWLAILLSPPVLLLPAQHALSPPSACLKICQAAFPPFTSKMLLPRRDLSGLLKLESLTSVCFNLEFQQFLFSQLPLSFAPCIRELNVLLEPRVTSFFYTWLMVYQLVNTPGPLELSK